MKKVLSVVIGTAIFLSMLHVGKAMWIYGKAHLSYYLISSAWEETLNGGEQVKPWPWADTWPIAKLKVPKMGLSYFVLRGDSGRTLAFAPGHAVDSSEPGEPGVTLISGHRDTHFSFLTMASAIPFPTCPQNRIPTYLVETLIGEAPFGFQSISY